MRTIRISVELSDDEYASYAGEAERQGRKVEQLIEQMVRGLIRELKQEQEEGTDHPIIPA